jgi:cytochrome c-type biogenesis protein CcmH
VKRPSKAPLKTRARTHLLVVLLLIAKLSLAQAATAPELDARLQQLGTELRCLVCQNESLADSNAPLALDLKREIRSRMEAGHSNEQIRSFLVERYGDFVTYKPPLDARTALLWGSPWILLLTGGFFLLRHLKHEQASETSGPVL